MGQTQNRDRLSRPGTDVMVGDDRVGKEVGAGAMLFTQ